MMSHSQRYMPLVLRTGSPIVFQGIIYSHSLITSSGSSKPLQGTGRPGESRDLRQTMDLRDLARDLINNSLAPSTRRVYASGQKRYLEFCRKGSLTPFPLSEEQLCTFVAYLMDEGLQHTSIKGYLSAISNSYITGARDVRHLLHRSPRAEGNKCRASRVHVI